MGKSRLDKFDRRGIIRTWTCGVKSVGYPILEEYYVKSVKGYQPGRSHAHRKHNGPRIRKNKFESYHCPLYNEALMYATEEFMALPFFVVKTNLLRGSICSYHEPIVFTEDIAKEYNARLEHKDVEHYDSSKAPA